MIHRRIPISVNRNKILIMIINKINQFFYEKSKDISIKLNRKKIIEKNIIIV